MSNLKRDGGVSIAIVIVLVIIIPELIIVFSLENKKTALFSGRFHQIDWFTSFV
jgi:hypothetical protein